MIGVYGVEPVSNHDDDLMGIGGGEWRIGTGGVAVELGHAAGVECPKGILSEPYACVREPFSDHGSAATKDGDRTCPRRVRIDLLSGTRCSA